MDENEQLRWELKQSLAEPSIFYGDGGTIHHSGELDIEMFEGKVVSVWFRCMLLPFTEHEVKENRASEMRGAYNHEGSVPDLTGVEVKYHAQEPV